MQTFVKSYHYRMFFVLIAIVISSVSPLSANTESLTLTSEFQSSQVGMFISYLEDKDGSLSIEDVEKSYDTKKNQPLKWTKSESASPSFGFTTSTYWFRWQIHNETQSDFKYYLEVGYPVIDHISLFTRNEDGSFLHKETGDLLPFHHRDISYRNPVFVLNEKANNTSTLYLRVQTSSTFVVPLTVWSPENFTENAIRDETMLGLFYGTMIVMLIYNLFILASIRDKSYFFYVGYILFWTLFNLTFNGLAFEYLWPDSIWWANNCLNLFAFITLAFMQQFAISFLDTKKNAPIVNKILTIMFAISIAGIIGSVILPYRIGIQLVSLHAILSVIIILTAGFISQRSGYKPARYFMLGWTFMLSGLLVLTLRNFGVFPENLVTRWSSQFGSALEVVFLALGLADRINVMKAERLAIEREAYETKLRLLDAFARFVPNQFLNILGRSSVEDIKTGDATEKHLAVLFTDIRNFTSMSEKMNSEDNFRFLNSYLKKMGPVILNNGGFIDKFIGDAIMALFPGNPTDTVKCAIEMRHQLQHFNEERRLKGYEPIEMGIGIHYGSVMLGTVGSEVRLETTVIGDTVNLSSRLESLTKRYRSNILISGELYDTIKDQITVRVREIDQVLLKGRSSPSIIYEIYEADPPELVKCKDENKELFERAYHLYRNGDFSAAIDVFTDYQNRCPDDLVGPVFIQRCLKLADRDDIKDWKGVIKLRE